MDDDFIPGKQHAPLNPKSLRQMKILVQKVALFKKNNEIKNPVFLQRLREFAQEVEGISADKFVMNSSYFRSFLARPAAHSPTASQVNLIYRYLDHEGAWDTRASNRRFVSSMKNHMFYSLMEFLEVPEITTANLLERLPGVYRCYRPIVTHPGKFVVGALRIVGDDSTGTIRYCEINRISKQAGREEKKITFEGYCVRKTNFVSLFSSDTSKSSVHLTILSNCEVQDGKYHTMFGGFLDTIGSQVYAGRVIMERVAELENCSEQEFSALAPHLDCIDKVALPESIKSFFDNDDPSMSIKIF